jgi:peroxiredoxin
MLIQLLFVVVGVLSNNLYNTTYLPPYPQSGVTQENSIASLRLCARSFNYTPSDSLTVYIFLEDECLISQFYTNELTRLYDKYHKDHVGFIGYFPSPMTGSHEIEAFADKFKLKFPLLPDPDKTWTRKFEITVTPEVSLLDHRTDRTIYKGRIDDSYVRVGKRKLHPQSHDLEDMIKAWQLNQIPDTLVQTQAIGCFITFTE